MHVLEVNYRGSMTIRARGVTKGRGDGFIRGSLCFLADQSISSRPRYSLIPDERATGGRTGDGRPPADELPSQRPHPPAPNLHPTPARQPAKLRPKSYQIQRYATPPTRFG